MNNGIYEITLKTGETVKAIKNEYGKLLTEDKNAAYKSFKYVREDEIEGEPVQVNFYLPLSSGIISRYEFLNEQVNTITVIRQDLDQFYVAENGERYFPWELTPDGRLKSYLRTRYNAVTMDYGYDNTNSWTLIDSPLMGICPVNDRGYLAEGRVLRKRSMLSGFPKWKVLQDNGNTNDTIYTTIMLCYNDIPNKLLTLNNNTAISDKGELWSISNSFISDIEHKCISPMYFYETLDELICNEKVEIGTVVVYLPDSTKSEYQIVGKHNRKYLMVKRNDQTFKWFRECQMSNFLMKTWEDIKLPIIRKWDEGTRPVINPQVGDWIEFMSKSDLEETYGFNEQGHPKTVTTFSDEMFELCGKSGTITAIDNNSRTIHIDFKSEDYNERFSKFRLSTEFLTSAKYKSNFKVKKFDREDLTNKLTELDTYVCLTKNGEIFDVQRKKDGRLYYAVCEDGCVYRRYADTDGELVDEVEKGYITAIFKGDLAWHVYVETDDVIYINTDYKPDEDYLVKTNRL